MARRTAQRSAQEKRSVVIWLSLFLGFFGQLSFAFNLSVTAGIVAYLMAGGVFFASLRGNETDNRSPFCRDYLSDLGKIKAVLGDHKWIEWLLLAGLVALATFFRLHSLESQPSSLWLDESLTGLNALEIIEGKMRLFGE